MSFAEFGCYRNSKQGASVEAGTLGKGIGCWYAFNDGRILESREEREGHSSGNSMSKLKGTDIPGVSGGQNVEGPWGEILELYLEVGGDLVGGSKDEIVHPGSLGVLERQECCLSRGVAASGGFGASFSSRGVD